MSLLFKKRVMTPGPTDVPPDVLLEMAQPIIHHRTKAFQAIYKEMSEGLKKLFRTSSPVLTIAGSGTTSFEAAQISLIEPGRKALTISGGKFGERWQDVYDTYGVEQIKINVPWGDAVDPAQIEQALKDNPDISVVCIVASETSTATYSDIRAIAKVVQQSNALLIVDGITAVGALPVEMDAWGIDVLVTGSQKAMMLPPGLGFVGLGDRAILRLEQTDGLPCYNLDLRKWLKSYEKNDVPFTPPVSLIRGQNVALKSMEAIGLDNIWIRTAKLAAATRAAFTAMGLKLCSTSPSDSVTGAFYPDGIDDSKFRGAVRDNHAMAIAGGQDGRGASWKGKIFRVNHMGYVDAGDTLAAMMAIEAELIAAGVKITPGTAVAAAAKALAQ
ncbi:MAG: aminotransferase class V-fold PLP-dependent enzyme [Phycisphaera sp.]|nr:aminotransferase class V-fold PLP-dependent enzyme [Phycisphaera sp.]